MTSEAQRVPHGELMAKKWLDSVEKQKRRIDLKECAGLINALVASIP